MLAAALPVSLPCAGASTTSCSQVIQELHGRYDTLQAELAEALDKALEAPVDAEAGAEVLQRRALLKLAVDLELTGIVPTAARLQQAIAQLVCMLRGRCHRQHAAHSQR
jgi:hypothetical protein